MEHEVTSIDRSCRNSIDGEVAFHEVDRSGRRQIPPLSCGEVVSNANRVTAPEELLDQM
jgi:hypothetical protein